MILRTELVISDLLKDFDKVRVQCPKCNRGSAYKVGRVRHNPNLKCPTCRTAFSVNVVGCVDAASAVKTFLCHACASESRVRDIESAATRTSLVCEHCFSENILRRPFMAGDPNEIEIVGVQSDGITVEWGTAKGR